MRHVFGLSICSRCCSQLRSPAHHDRKSWVLHFVKWETSELQIWNDLEPFWNHVQDTHTTSLLQISEDDIFHFQVRLRTHRNHRNSLETWVATPVPQNSVNLCCLNPGFWLPNVLERTSRKKTVKLLQIHHLDHLDGTGTSISSYINLIKQVGSWDPQRLGPNFPFHQRTYRGRIVSRAFRPSATPELKSRIGSFGWSFVGCS